MLCNLKMAVSYVHTCQTHETYLPDNSCPKHFQLKVIRHHCLLEGYVGTGHHVSEACFVHVTVAVVLGFHCMYLNMEPQQQLQRGLIPRHPQKKLITVTVCVLAEPQPVTLACLLYMFCSWQHKA